MNVNPMIAPTLVLSLLLCTGGFLLTRRTSGPWTSAALGVLAIPAAVPGALMALYYAHWFEAMLLVLLVPYAKPVLAPARYEAFQDKWDGRVCKQSTGSSCGAASAATVLRRCGIETTERELAVECYTCATGTESWYLARAFRKRGLEAHCITRPPLPRPLPAPCIAGIRLGAIGHFIAIIEDRNDVVLTGDPRIGPRQYRRADLARDVDFTGFFLVVNPKK